MKPILYSIPSHLSDYLYLYSIELKKFMKQKPPCAMCMKEVRCIRILKEGSLYTYGTAALEIKVCEDLMQFVIN